MEHALGIYSHALPYARNIPFHTPAQLRAGPAMAHKGGMCRITGHGKTSTQNSGVQERPLMAVPCRMHRIPSDIQIGAAHGSGSTRVGLGHLGRVQGAFSIFLYRFFFIISQQTDKHRLGELAFSLIGTKLFSIAILTGMSAVEDKNFSMCKLRYSLAG